MRFAYAHFPINALVSNGGKTIEIKNFLGMFIESFSNYM